MAFDAAARVGDTRRVIRPVIKSMRPHQWVKNSFVLAPLVFAQELTSSTAIVRAVLATLLFCGVSGAVYLMNDSFDVEKDRAHPLKRKRPVAAGDLSVAAARRASLVVATVAISAGFALSWKFAAAATYLVVNLAYSRRLKHIAYVDVLTIAFGFLVRIVAGALAIDVPVSVWLFACTFLLALFMGMGKRRHELLETMGDVADKRSVLSYYQLGPLTIAMIGAALATTAAYTAYTVEDHQHDFGTDFLPATIPFCVIGLTRFFMLTGQTRTSASPTEQIVRDPPFVANLACWAVLVLYLIYFQ